MKSDINEVQRQADKYNVGQVYPSSRKDKKYGSYKLNSLNTYPMRRVWKIICAKEEPYKSENIVNFINEGPSNCILKNKALYASRDILIDEELLLKYPANYNRYWLASDTINPTTHN